MEKIVKFHFSNGEVFDLTMPKKDAKHVAECVLDGIGFFIQDGDVRLAFGRGQVAWLEMHNAV